MADARTTATVSIFGTRITLRTGEWSETFPAEAVDARIAFYTRLRDRAGGRYAHHYEPTVAALIEAKRIAAERRAAREAAA